MTTVEMDLERDLFRVTGTVARDAVLATIGKLGYVTSLADPAAFRVAPERSHPTGDAPGLVRQACERARAEKKLVLVDCMGDS